MRNLVRGTAGLAIVAMLVGASGGIAAAKSVPDSKYAKSLCGGIKKITDAYNKTADDYNALPTDDPAAFQTSAAGLVDQLIATVQGVQKKLKKLSPEDGGKKVTKIFDAYFKEITSKLTDAVAKFRAADPNGVAFQGDVTQFQVAFNILNVGVDDPFSKLNDVDGHNDLADGFDNEKTCKGIVNVTNIGG